MSKHYTVNTLENGLKVAFTPFEGLDSAKVFLRGRVGSLWENNDELGSSHFLEHTVLAGTKKYPKIRDLKSVISDIGGNYRAHTAFDRMVFEAKTLKKDLESSFDFLSQVAIYPLITEDEVLKQRSIITQELNRKLDNPNIRFIYNFNREAIYEPGYRKNIPNIGTLESINSTTKETLDNFHKENFTGGNFVLSVCADLPEKKVLDLAEKYFGDMKEGSKNDFPDLGLKKGFRIYSENDDKIKQSTIYLFFEGPRDYLKKTYALDYASVILGQSPNARLMHELRYKRGLVYTAQSHYDRYFDYGFFEVATQVDQKNAGQALKIIKDEIKKLKEEKISAQEYEMAKNILISRFVFNNELAENRTGLSSRFVLDDQDLDYKSLMEEFGSVTIDDVYKATSDILAKEPKICVLSPSLTEEEIRKAWEEA